MKKMRTGAIVTLIALLPSSSAIGADSLGSTRLSSLPATAQKTISGVLGRDNPGYAASATGFCD